MLKIKLTFRNKGLLLFLLFQSINLVLAADENIEVTIPSTSPRVMPFKLGMEFQESHSLCKWALENNSFQRKPFLA